MPTLVHLADEKNSKKILKNGIKIAKGMPGIFAMPVTQNFFISHQWLRELKRNGAKNYVGVYFKMKSEEIVYAGIYNKPHQYIPLGVAVKEILSIPDPRGYEMIVLRKIEASEIVKIKTLPHNVGWRYSPDSHSITPNCSCVYCIATGGIKSKRLKDKIDTPKKIIK